MSLDPIAFGAEFQVNTATSDDQLAPSIAALSDGGYVVSWASLGQDGDNWGIYAQRYDSGGVAVGAEFQVNTYTTNIQFSPSITSLSDGGFVVTWHSFIQDTDSNGIYGQRYDSSGAIVGGEFHISTETVAAQSHPSITSMSDGGYVVAWQSFTQDGDGYGIFAQRYDSSGAAYGGEFQINTYTTDSQSLPAITGLNDGGFLVTWHSSGQDGSNLGVFGQRYDSSSAMVGSEFQINSYTALYQGWPSNTALLDGGFVVTWGSYNQDGSFYGIFGQRYDSGGAVVGAEFQINTYTDSYQTVPSVTAMADGGFLVVWYSKNQDGDNFGIFGQRFDSSGESVGAEFQVNTFTTDEQQEPKVTSLADGSFVVSWESNGQDGDGFGVYAQQYAAQLFGTSGVDVIEDTIGANWLNGQKGDDELLGKGGDDEIFGGNGKDTLKGGAGADILKGGGSKDTLIGGGGEDNLRGGKGNDELDGGVENDGLTGGEGKDKFVFKLGYGEDKITDFEDDIDTYRLDEDLWGGGMTKQQVINTYASVVGSDIVFDFGADQLRLKGFTDLGELKDDMLLI